MPRSVARIAAPFRTSVAATTRSSSHTDTWLLTSRLLKLELGWRR